MTCFEIVMDIFQQSETNVFSGCGTTYNGCTEEISSQQEEVLDDHFGLQQHVVNTDIVHTEISLFTVCAVASDL